MICTSDSHLLRECLALYDEGLTVVSACARCDFTRVRPATLADAAIGDVVGLDDREPEPAVDLVAA